ncbi:MULTISPECIES: GNAT family N-acetyltransferase [unclassified Devosia]|uniref:GNAT family N-acetyltransferase n=1 Tax=unclassified Devosia TaxID=196773 RepID=UPI000715B1C8|nr:MULTISPECIES: GNAT family N-acetyltransferase [unclassified Devosia]KQN78286.1 acetyltransferase [Devosia sp. Leaf64]KQT44187.1 acetyltransferase [Devosia sp. Leaf420]
MTDSFLYTLPTDPVALPLVEQLTEEYQTRYGNYFEEGGAAQEMNRYPPERFGAPDGAFVLLLRNGKPIAGGAFMRYDETTAEFKRVWTDRDHRRQGLARKILVELEAQALRQGYGRVYLTTGFRQPEARELYLRTGYTALFDLQADPESIQILAFEKALVAPRAAFANENGSALQAAVARK